MKTTTSNSIRVKARRDAWDLGGVGREDGSSIGFDTPGHVDDRRPGGDRPTSRPGTLAAGQGHTDLGRRPRWSAYRDLSRPVDEWRGMVATNPRIFPPAEDPP